MASTKAEARNFLECYKAKFGGYLVPLSNSDLGPEQLDRVANEVEKVLFADPTIREDISRLLHNPESKQITPFAKWMEHLTEKSAIWDVVEGPHVEFDDFEKHYTNRYGTLLHPISDQPPTEKQVKAIRELFNETIDNMTIAHELRKVNESLQALEVLAEWWKIMLRGHKRNYERAQEMIASGKLNKPENLDDDKYAVLFQ